MPLKRKESKIMKYLKNIQTLEQLKKEYRNWAMKLHPDCGGIDQDMQTLNNEYEQLFEVMQIRERYQKPNAKEATEETAKTYPNIINKLVHMEGLEIEIIGYWIWIGGNSYPYREDLKEIGFRWSKGRKKWYYSTIGLDSKGYYKKEKFNTLRNRYGSQKIETQEQKALNG